jgi:hypothetical protein
LEFGHWNLLDLGRRQMASQETLDLPFRGSNPLAPASRICLANSGVNSYKF